MKLWKLTVSIGIMIVLTGCVSVVVPPATKDTSFLYLLGKKRQARVSKQKYFVASGAFSISEVGKRPVLANYQWIQNNIGFYHIRISSALNLFNVIILGRLHSVTLWKSPRKHVTASTPEALVKREMGWTLPVRNLYYWIRGVAALGCKRLLFDQYGHLITLNQDGWHITYSSFKTVKGYDLPQKIILTRPNLRIKIIVKHWILTIKKLPLQ